MPNIQFNYLYRDAGNYKAFGNVIFADPGNYTLEQLTQIIQHKLIDGLWFYAEEWCMPDLRNTDNSYHPTWHEFENLEHTYKPATIQNLLQLLILQKNARLGV